MSSVRDRKSRSTELFGQNLYDWWDKCSCKVRTRAATKYHLETAVGYFVCRLFHKAGNVHITALTKAKAAIITFVSVEAKIPEDEVRFEISHTRDRKSVVRERV